MSETQPDAKRSRSSDEKGTICVSGAEGEDVRWPLWAARHAGTLKNWIEDSDGEGSFPAPNISADTLRSLLALLTARLAIAGVPVIDSALASLSPDKLTAVARAANFLAVSDVLVAAARELCRRFLTGKSVDDLRVALGVGLDESLNEAEQAAALSELAFTPDDAPSRLLAVEPRCAPFAAALEAGRLMPVDVTIDDDTLELMLHETPTRILTLSLTPNPHILTPTLTLTPTPTLTLTLTSSQRPSGPNTPGTAPHKTSRPRIDEWAAVDGGACPFQAPEMRPIKLTGIVSCPPQTITRAAPLHPLHRRCIVCALHVAPPDGLAPPPTLRARR
jgi:hypothetical protein